jgi:protein TonB
VIIAKSPIRSQSDRLLFAAIAFSIGLHALVMLVHFSSPETFRFKSSDEKLDVIIVNKKGTRPVKATALAQVDSNGGGVHDSGRASSFLPASAQASDGETIDPSNGQVSALEAKQQELMSQIKASTMAVSPHPAQQEDPLNQPAEMTDNNQARSQITRMEAEVRKEISDYNARPRRVQIGPSTRYASYAMYYTQWIDRVERYGNVNYPVEARGKIYGDLILSVSLNPDGSIYNDEINIMQSSGFKVLDRAAKATIKMAAPFAPFDSAMRQDFTVYELIVKFSYTRGDGFEARFEKH